MNPNQPFAPAPVRLLRASGAARPVSPPTAQRPLSLAPPRRFQAACADRLQLACLLRSLNGAG
jgi:hypothetical protein